MPPAASYISICMLISSVRGQIEPGVFPFWLKSCRNERKINNKNITTLRNKKGSSSYAWETKVLQDFKTRQNPTVAGKFKPLPPSKDRGWSQAQGEGLACWCPREAGAGQVHLALKLGSCSEGLSHIVRVGQWSSPKGHTKAMWEPLPRQGLALPRTFCGHTTRSLVTQDTCRRGAYKQEPRTCRNRPLKSRAPA